MSVTRYDLIIVGGGLSGGLLAYRLSQKRPELKVLLIEKDHKLGGNHTWSFHGGDLAESDVAWIKPFIIQSWADHEVCFPKLARTIPAAYFSLSSERFHEVLSLALPSISLGQTVTEVGVNFVLLENGKKLEAGCVVDARGFAKADPRYVGYQKFVGLDLELTAPHGLKRPVLMDTMVEQGEDFRFFYLLPWSETTLLIEDTRYSLSPELPVEDLRTSIHAYARQRGWQAKRVIREETGVLPIPLREKYRQASTDTATPAIGVRADLFHATTGYSLPYAVRTANEISELKILSLKTVQAALSSHAKKELGSAGLYRILNRMLFLGAKPSERVGVMQRFYTLSDSIIARFYSGRLNSADRLALFAGTPPIAVHRALNCLFENKGLINEHHDYRV